jgi:hypothetical protein
MILINPSYNYNNLLDIRLKIFLIKYNFYFFNFMLQTWKKDML